jgi:acetyl-CoA C-acetyltransferase
MEDPYVAGHGAVKTGIPIEVSTCAVNRICGSGLEEINTATRCILRGDGSMVVAHGTASITRVPRYVRSGRHGYRSGDAYLADDTQHLQSDLFRRVPEGTTSAKFRKSQGEEVSRGSKPGTAPPIKASKFKDEPVPLDVEVGCETKVTGRKEHSLRGPAPRQLCLHG